MERIEKIQYQAVTLAVTGTWKGSNSIKLYEELVWESLSDRRWHRRLTQMYTVHNNLTPTYLRNILPQSRRTAHGQMTYHNIFCRTSKHKNSFFSETLKSWNSIINDFQGCSSLISFKTSIISLVQPKPRSIFRIYSWTYWCYMSPHIFKSIKVP